MLHLDFIKSMKNITLAIILCLSNCLIAQTLVRKADRFFNQNDFEKAAVFYEKALEKQNSSYLLTQLGECYINTNDYSKAVNSFEKLFKLPNVDTLSQIKTYKFKYYQSLLMSGNTEKAINYYYRKNSEVLKAFNELSDENKFFTLSDVNYNSKYSDFGAIHYGDSIYFVSDRPVGNAITKHFKKKYKWTKRGYLNIYKTIFNQSNDSLNSVVELASDLNSPFHEGNMTLSQDGKIMYISKSNLNGFKAVMNASDNNTIQIYKYENINNKWQLIGKPSFVNVNYNFEHPTLSSDGKHLYFSSNLPGGEGEYDIYGVPVLEDGSYGAIYNLGKNVNTERREQFPFIAKNGDLYFSSNGHLGLGGLDVFVSTKVGDVFAKATNLGAPLNSNRDDYSFYKYADKNGYISSNRTGVDNIFKCTQVATLKNAKRDIRIEFRDLDTNELLEFETNVSIKSIDGKGIYEMPLAPATPLDIQLKAGKYLVKSEASDFENTTTPLEVHSEQNQVLTVKLKRIISKEVSEIIEAKNIDKNLAKADKKRFELLVDTEGFEVVESDGKLLIKVPPIYFSFNKWNISKNSKSLLDDLVVKMNKYPNIHLVISSHTDTRGEAVYNQLLSDNRAKSTYNYLVSNGIDSSRLSYVGYGESRPVKDCGALRCTEKEHELNRRSEFEIVKY